MKGSLEHRLLVLAPTHKDGRFTRDLLARQGIACESHTDAARLVRAAREGAAAVLLAEEVLADGYEALSALLAEQPSWSDLPIVLITLRGVDSTAVSQAVETLGNVTLLERPVRVQALLSTVRAALRARARQYETRAHLEALQEADRRKDEFLATLAHELRNPLAPLLNAVQVLRMPKGAARASSAGEPLLEIMHRQAKHMARLVDDLMEVSRITRGKIELRRELLPLNDVMRVALEASQPLIDSAGHRLVVDLPRDPIHVDGDGTRLAQVFANLLNNAAKYTEPGGRIELRATRERDAAVVSVRDTGVGIAPQMLAPVFDMFVQAKAAGACAAGGLGIGLTLVRTLVEMHGGSVHAHSDGAGRGSEFVVRLPLARAPRPEPAPAQPPRLAPSAAPRVLVVDDNRDAAQSLGMLLELLGARVHIVHDGRAALEAVQAQWPAAVFLDIGMPDMDGYEVARRIRRKCDARGPTLVAVTGWGHEGARRETGDAGFDHHLIKPAGLADLQALLADIVPGPQTDRRTGPP